MIFIYKKYINICWYMLLGNPRPIHESDLGNVMEGAILHVQRQQGIHDDDCNEIKTMHAPALLFTQHLISMWSICTVYKIIKAI